jgi:hypothetical protein
MKLFLWLSNYVLGHEILWKNRSINPRFHDLGTGWR